jgi:transcriptional regulator with XRE-family HTH domain
MSQVELARQLGVDRVTVYRWESGKQRPENLAIVQRVAEVLELPVDEVLAAAGLLLGTPAPTKPSREPPMPPELLDVLRLLADPDTSAADKEYIRRTLINLSNLPPVNGERHRRSGT